MEKKKKENIYISAFEQKQSTWTVAIHRCFICIVLKTYM